MLPQAEKRALIKKLFQEEYQGKTLTYKKLDEEMFVRINATTLQNYTERKAFEERKEHRAKLNLGAAGEFMRLITDPEYQRSLEEQKIGQSKQHVRGSQYHYFQKFVMVDGYLYALTINVRETYRHNCFVHSVSLKEKRDLPSLT